MKAKRRLSNFDFSSKNAHVALVDRAANGLKILVQKSLSPEEITVEQYEKTEFSQEQRDSLARSGAAMPDGSYPIRNTSDLKHAIQAFGRAKDKGAAARHIKRRAKALGASDMLPDHGELQKHFVVIDELEKAFSDKMKYDSATGQMHPHDMSGHHVKMPLEDALHMLTGLYPEHIETLTAAINKSANGDELVAALEKAEPAVADFAARKLKFKSVLDRLDGPTMKLLASFVNLKPQVEKSDMTTTTTPVPAEVQKALDAQAAELAATKAELAKSEAARTQLAADTAILKAAHDAREAQAFVTKAGTLKGLFAKDATEVSVGKALQTISKSAPAEYAVVEQMLVTAADIIAKGKELSTTGYDGQPTGGLTASDELTKAAAELRKADPKLSPEQAVTKALEQNPALYGK